MSQEVSRREWFALMLACVPADVKAQIQAAPEAFKIVDGRMGENSCQYLCGPNGEWIAYSVGWWNGKWALFHEVTLSPPPQVVIDNAQTIRELIGVEPLRPNPYLSDPSFMT